MHRAVAVEGVRDVGPGHPAHEQRVDRAQQRNQPCQGRQRHPLPPREGKGTGARRDDEQRHGEHAQEQHGGGGGRQRAREAPAQQRCRQHPQRTRYRGPRQQQRRHRRAPPGRRVETHVIHLAAEPVEQLRRPGERVAGRRHAPGHELAPRPVALQQGLQRQVVGEARAPVLGYPQPLPVVAPDRPGAAPHDARGRPRRQRRHVPRQHGVHPRHQAGRLRSQPAVAGGHGDAVGHQRPDQVVQQVGVRLDVGVAEGEHLRLLRGGGHGGQQVVDLLRPGAGQSGDDVAHVVVARGQRSDQRDGGVRCALGDERHQQRAVTLRGERGQVTRQVSASALAWHHQVDRRRRTPGKRRQPVAGAPPPARQRRRELHQPDASEDHSEDQLDGGHAAQSGVAPVSAAASQGARALSDRLQLFQVGVVVVLPTLLRQPREQHQVERVVFAVGAAAQVVTKQERGNAPCNGHAQLHHHALIGRRAVHDGEDGITGEHVAEVALGYAVGPSGTRHVPVVAREGLPHLGAQRLQPRHDGRQQQLLLLLRESVRTRQIDPLACHGYTVPERTRDPLHLAA